MCGRGPFVGISTGSHEREREGRGGVVGWGKKGRDRNIEQGMFSSTMLLVFSFIMIYMSRKQRCTEIRGDSQIKRRFCVSSCIEKYVETK